TPGSASTTSAGSRYGIGGTSTRPAPIRRGPDAPDRRVVSRRDVAVVERAGRVLAGMLAGGRGEPPDTGAWAASARGAMPQRSQYPSTIVPVQPGRVQLNATLPRTVPGPGGPGRTRAPAPRRA